MLAFFMDRASGMPVMQPQPAAVHSFAPQNHIIDHNAVQNLVPNANTR